MIRQQQLGRIEILIEIMQWRFGPLVSMSHMDTNGPYRRMRIDIHMRVIVRSTIQLDKTTTKKLVNVSQQEGFRLEYVFYTLSAPICNRRRIWDHKRKVLWSSPLG